MKKKNIKNMPFNKAKAVEKGFEWFEMIIDDYVKRNIIAKPTKSEVRDVFEKLTGKKVSPSKSDK